MLRDFGSSGSGGTEIDQSLEIDEIEAGSESEYDSWDRVPARIKVIGVGGGCNCVRRMLQHNVRGVEYVMVNTDIKSLEMGAEGADLVEISQKVTRGWGAGGLYQLFLAQRTQLDKYLDRLVSKDSFVLAVTELSFVDSVKGIPHFIQWREKQPSYPREFSITCRR